MHRWGILPKRISKKYLRGAANYLHCMVGDDWSRDMHDHPKPFLSIGLWGSYVEETPTGTRTYKAPWIRTFPAHHVHRLRLAPGCKRCWTLVFTGPETREWGFWEKTDLPPVVNHANPWFDDKQWVYFDTYIARQMLKGPRYKGEHNDRD